MKIVVYGTGLFVCWIRACRLSNDGGVAADGMRDVCCLTFIMSAPAVRTDLRHEKLTTFIELMHALLTLRNYATCHWLHLSLTSINEFIAQRMVTINIYNTIKAR